MSQDSPAALIYDATNGPVTVKTDGSDKRFCVDAKLTGSSSSQQVEGIYARESVSVPFPVVIGARYAGDGKLKEVACDSIGRLIAVSDVVNGKTLELNYSAQYAISGDFLNVWFKGIHYTIPAGYKFNVGSIYGRADDNKSALRLGKFIVMGSFNLGTQVFTDGSLYTTPEFAAYLEVEIVTPPALTNEVIVTTTYVNQSGVAGRTATATITKKAWAAGAKIPAPLQSGDYGVLDVTNVTRNLAETGTINVNGVMRFWEKYIVVAGESNMDTFSKDVVIGRAGDVMTLDFLTTGAANVVRTVRAVGVLEPI